MVLTFNLKEQVNSESALVRDLESALIFKDRLECLLNFENKINVLHVGVVVNDKEVDIIWRVHDSDFVDSVLKGIVNSSENTENFNYEMFHDLNWEEVYFFSTLKNSV